MQKVSEDSLVQRDSYCFTENKGICHRKETGINKKLGYSMFIAVREAWRQFSGHAEKQHLFVP